MSDPLVPVERLSVRLPAGGDREFAVEDLSFTLDRGEILCVVGEPGSGKSTLGRIIVRLVPPDSGHILYHGQDMMAPRSEEFRERRKSLQMIFQDPLSSLNPRKRIGIARALMMNPDVIVADEPVSALDASVQA